VERVVLVDEEDRPIGVEEKWEAHLRGQLHRAFSVFVFDGSGRLLLQRRAAGKYHSGGLWSNTCCGHPRPGEPLLAAARRRLEEEMGFACPLAEVSTYRYRALLAGGLWENEVDHLLAGEFAGAPAPDPREAEAWRWVDPAALRREIAADPRQFTVWFRGCLEQALAAARLRPTGRAARG
jgi:isopentenyl-diphosphate delta-isomerase